MYRNSINSNPAPSASQGEVRSRKYKGKLVATSQQLQPEDLSAPGSPSSSSCFPGVGPGSRNGVGNRLLLFCDIVLKHTDYPHAFRTQNSDEEESSSDTKSGILVKNESRITTSPLNSVGESAIGSTRSGSSITGSEVAELETEEFANPEDKEAYDMITCYCGLPYAGRPMIECDRCLIWLHMSCEGVIEGHVPDEYFCKRCKSKKKRRRPSASSRKGGKKKRRSSAAVSSSTGSEAAPPLLQMEQVGCEQMPSPLRQDPSAPNHSASFNGTGASSHHEGFPGSRRSEPLQGTSRGSSSSRSSPKKKGRKRSSSGVNGLTAQTSISLSQLGLNGVDAGEPGQSVPSTISQPPPLLPCYVANDLPAATPETQRLDNGHHAILNGDSNGISSSHTFPSIPVLEPQVVGSTQQSSKDLKGLFPSRSFPTVDGRHNGHY